MYLLVDSWNHREEFTLTELQNIIDNLYQYQNTFISQKFLKKFQSYKLRKIQKKKDDIKMIYDIVYNHKDNSLYISFSSRYGDLNVIGIIADYL